MPAPILIAIWGLETNYGADFERQVLDPALAGDAGLRLPPLGLLHRPLLDALRIVERGDLTPAQMRGGWAGEIGHTQFLPSGYYKYAVDFDGDGRRDLEHSVPDMLASTANFLKATAGRRGRAGRRALPITPSSRTGIGPKSTSARSP